MQVLIWIGAAISMAGVGGLIYCVMRALAARKSGLADDAMRAALQKVVLINVAALGVSALGLMLVVAGIMLG